MCNSDADSGKFIRRKDAAVRYMQGLLDRYSEITGPQAIEITTDKFSLNASVRDDYRIYKALWNIIEG